MFISKYSTEMFYSADANMKRERAEALLEELLRMMPVSTPGARKRPIHIPSGASYASSPPSDGSDHARLRKARCSPVAIFPSSAHGVLNVPKLKAHCHGKDAACSGC